MSDEDQEHKEDSDEDESLELVETDEEVNYPKETRQDDVGLPRIIRTDD